MMCIAPYIQNLPLVLVVDIKNAALLGSSMGSGYTYPVYSSAGTTKVTQLGIPVPRPLLEKAFSMDNLIKSCDDLRE